MLALSFLDPIEYHQLKEEHISAIRNQSTQLINSIREFIYKDDNGQSLIRRFIVYDNRILLLSLLPIGLGSWCRAHHAIFLDDIVSNSDIFKAYVVLMPENYDDLWSLKNMHLAAVKNQRQIGFFPHASADQFLVPQPQSDIKYVTLKIEQSLLGQSLASVISSHSSTVSQINFAIIQVLLAQMHLQRLGLSHGDASVNNFIISPDMATAVAIDLSTLKGASADINLNGAISTVFDPAIGPQRRNAQVDPFVLAMTTLYMLQNRLHEKLSERICQIYKLCMPRPVVDSSIITPKFIDVPLSESGDYTLSPCDSDNTGESLTFELSPHDNLVTDNSMIFNLSPVNPVEYLFEVFNEYTDTYNLLATEFLTDQPSSVIAFLIQSVAPIPEVRPDLWDCFNCVTIKESIISVYLSDLVRQNYPSDQAERCLRQLQLINNSALSEHPNFNGCLSLFAILVYGCYSCKAHPLAIRQQVDNLLAIIVHHMPDFFQVPLLVDRSLSNLDGIKTFADILLDLESMLQQRESTQSIDCQIYDPFLELLKEEIDSTATDALQDEIIKSNVLTLVDDMIEEVDTIAKVTTLLDDMANAIENAYTFYSATYKNSPSPNSVRSSVSEQNICLFNPVDVSLKQPLKVEPPASQSCVR